MFQSFFTTGIMKAISAVEEDDERATHRGTFTSSHKSYSLRVEPLVVVLKLAAAAAGCAGRSGRQPPVVGRV